MNNNKQVKRSIFGFGNYLVYFLASALVVTIIVLIVYQPTATETAASIRPRAILAFGAILALALVMTLLNGWWRRVTIGKPVKRILAATQTLTNGDFSVRIAPTHGVASVDELDAIIANFNIMAAELGSVEALQSDFIASVSHELKTPLAVIQNYATLLQDDTITTAARSQYSQKITAATMNLSVLITNILKLNKLDNQQITPQRDHFLLNDQLAETLVNDEPLWEAKKLDIETDLEEDIWLTTDRTLLALAWNNLLSNAIKFSPVGGTITVKLASTATAVSVSISDNGAGMTTAVQRHIFDKFYQADTAHSGNGNGLGLALVKRVVSLLNGHIEVVSAPGRGATFTVTLPTQSNQI